ncbi:transglutaminase [Pedobacter yulinensis]|uniref:Transglutaminase n=1 Tax=Pedobacter yulinensis TaxID=2126353 RepID=A0A2T3HI62_9SPHI|nr:DUF3857 domain-containing protein [Pedobacter yulinensis]PST82120.1 transglutaminase [Pedobacter yulinensis]
MQFKFIPALLFAALSCYAASAQTPAKPKFSKFGKVDAAEFAVRAPGADSAAAAIKIFDVGSCYFDINPTSGGFAYVYERHLRYKINSKNAYDLANFEIGLYRNSGSSRETLDNMEAATYNLENGKVVSLKMGKDARFTENVDRSNSIKKYTLPNVKEGSIIEYKYSIKSDFIFTLRDWSFQAGYPTLYSEYTVTIPEYFRYKVMPTGFFPISIAKQENVNANYHIPGAGSVSTTAQYTKYVTENAPAIKTEAFITTLSDYTAKLEFELLATNFPGDYYRDYTGNWSKIVGELAADENFGGYVKPSGYTRNLATELVGSDTSAMNRTTRIFEHVKRSLKWNGHHRMYTSHTSIKTAFEKKTGNSADINLALATLLNDAKIPARAVLVSTRDNGAHPGYPMLSKFNNVVVQALVGKETYLLDATDPEHYPGMLATASLNHTGLRIGDTGAAWIPIEATAPARENYQYNLELSSENKLSGTLYHYNSGHKGVHRRNSYRQAASEPEFVKAFKADKPGLNILKYKVDALDSLQNPFVETMEVAIEEQVEEAGDLIYFNPLLFQRTKENPFTLEERKFPVDFAYPSEEVYRIVLTFPKNYTIEKTPKSQVFKLPDNTATFSFIFNQQDNQILITSKIAINKSMFSSDEYLDLKELFKNVVSKQAEQLVFKKI